MSRRRTTSAGPECPRQSKSHAAPTVASQTSRSDNEPVIIGLPNFAPSARVNGARMSSHATDWKR